MEINWGMIGAVATIVMPLVIYKLSKLKENKQSIQKVGGLFSKNAKVTQKNNSDSESNIQKVNTMISKDLEVEQENSNDEGK